MRRQDELLTAEFVLPFFCALVLVATMPTCLLALGSNLGDRHAVLRAALSDLDAIPLGRVVRSSRFQEFAPIGGPSGQANYLNAAVVLKTQLDPFALHHRLLEIEQRHGRHRDVRWSARSLDIDLLLFDDLIVEMVELSIPHPRMSFRTFVLSPAAEIAGEMVVPTIGWTVAELWTHLRAENDWLAVVSTSHDLRAQVCQILQETFHAVVASPAVSNDQTIHWPPAHTAWLSLTPASSGSVSSLASSIALGPKLTVLVEPGSVAPSQLGCGPSLVLCSPNRADLEREVLAAIASAWPDLGRDSATGIE